MISSNTPPVLTPSPSPAETSDNAQWLRILGMVGLGIAVVLITIVATLYTRNQPQTAPDLNDARSQNRLDTINTILRTRFGPTWPYTLLTFSVLLLILAIVLSIRPEKRWQIEIAQTTGTRVLMLMTAFLILLGIGIVILFVYLYLSPVNYGETSLEPKEERKKRLEFLYGLALGMILLFGVTWFVVYMRSQT